MHANRIAHPFQSLKERRMRTSLVPFHRRSKHFSKPNLIKPAQKEDKKFPRYVIPLALVIGILAVQIAFIFLTSESCSSRPIPNTQKSYYSSGLGIVSTTSMEFVCRSPYVAIEPEKRSTYLILGIVMDMIGAAIIMFWLVPSLLKSDTLLRKRTRYQNNGTRPFFW